MLRVLLLIYEGKYGQIQVPPLPQSIQSLRNIRTLILLNWGLGDISVLGRLQLLETLELNNCSIAELPSDVSELEKLRLLGLRYCKIERNNPFEVIRSCQKLEELYYVLNWDALVERREDGVSKVGIPTTLQRYRIIGYRSSSSSSEVDASISRCFIPNYLIEVFSNETFSFLAREAEILELGEYSKTGWKNLVPDIIPIGYRGTKTLHLYDWSEIECLIQTDHHLHYGVTIFSKLIELKLSNMDVKELCCGPLPNEFLKQLERLELQGCSKLDNILFKGQIDLGNLKFIELQNCSMTSLFHPSTAQS